MIFQPCVVHMLSDTLDIHLELNLSFKVLCLYYCVFSRGVNGLGVLPWGATEGPLKLLPLVPTSTRKNCSLRNYMLLNAMEIF